MDPRRVPRATSDPKVRLGFFAPGDAPDRSQSGPPDPTSSSPPVSNISPSSNSLSPVMIPPPRLLSADLSRRFPQGRLYPIYTPLELRTILRFQLEVIIRPSLYLRRRLRSSRRTSLPAGGFGMVAVKQKSVANLAPDAIDRETNVEARQELGPASGNTLKEKTKKAERRAIQEAQRAKKASDKGGGGKASAAVSGVNYANANKAVKVVPLNKDGSLVASSEKKSCDHQPDKEEKK